MTEQNKPLEERVIVDQPGDEIKFTDMGRQLQDIAIHLYERSQQGTIPASYRLQGSPSDSAVFSGRMLTLLNVIRDFMIGEYDDKGRIKFGTGKGNMSVSLGGTLTDFTDIEYKPMEKK
jgi:hypothetical protein